VVTESPLHPDDELFNAEANELLPSLENEEDLLNLTEKLFKQGFTADETAKILGQNYLRMLEAVLKRHGQ